MATLEKSGKPKKVGRPKGSTKSKTKTKTKTTSGSKTKGGNFLGAVGELIAPTGWESFVTTAALVGIDRADAALRRGKVYKEKSNAKKGGADGNGEDGYKKSKDSEATDLLNEDKSLLEELKRERNIVLNKSFGFNENKKWDYIDIINERIRIEILKREELLNKVSHNIQKKLLTSIQRLKQEGNRNSVRISRVGLNIYRMNKAKETNNETQGLFD
jgi:hypothetical protein